MFETPKGSECLGSEFSRHPEGLSFKRPRSEFSRSKFSRHPLYEGLNGVNCLAYNDVFLVL